MKIILLIFTLVFSSLSFAWQPPKQVNVVMNMPVGSASDNAFRIVSHQVEKNTGVNFVVNYRLGAGGTIGNDFFVKAAPDGSTISPVPIPGLTGTDRMVNPNKTYNTSDFTFILANAFTPMTIIVHPDDSVKSIKDLIKVLKTEKTTAGDPGSGGRITYELFRAAANLEESTDRIVRVEYKGPTEVAQDVANKTLRFGIVPLAASSQLHIAGRIKILGVTSESRSPSFPDIPTVNSVLPGMVYNLGWVISLPKGADSQIVEWYNREFIKAMQNQDVVKKLHDSYFFIDKNLLTPKDITVKIIADEKRNAPIVNMVIQQRSKN